MKAAHRRALLLIAALVGGLAFVCREALRGRVYFGRDAMRFFIPDSAFLAEALRRGELPLWIPYIRLGQPFLATVQSQVLYPPHVLAVLAFGPVVGFTAQHVFHVAVAAIGTFLLCRALGASRLASSLGAGVFALSPMLADLAGQMNVVDAAAWSGWIALAADRVSRRASARNVAWLALAFAASFLAGSPEMLLWQGLVAAAVVLRRSARRIGAVALSGVWAVALGAAVLLPAIEFLRQSTRGAAQDTLEWSASWPQLLGLFWPLADHPRGAYWGGPDEWFVLTVFLGTIPFALAASAVRRGRRVRSLALVGILFLLLSAGRHAPGFAWVFALPPFGWFRYPGKYLVGVCFVVAVLAAMGLDRLAARARLRAASVRAAAVATGATLLVLGAGVPLVRSDWFRSGARGGWVWLVLALGLLAVAYLGAPGRGRGVRIAVAALAFVELGLFHLLQVRSGWTEPSVLTRSSVLAAAMGELPGRISVGGLGRADPRAEEAAGFQTHVVSRDALLGNRFVEERLHALEGGWTPDLRGVDEFHLSGARAVYDLTGVEYYLRQGPPPFGDLERVSAVEPVCTLYRSKTAMPRAFVVQRAEVVDDATALRRLTDELQPARQTAFLASGTPLSAEPCSGSSARVLEEGANRVEVDVTACAAGYLVLSDTHYPGWRAAVDGVQAALVRADYVLRAVAIPAGHHRVTFAYRPTSFRWGAWISLLSLAALFGATSRRSARERSSSSCRGPREPTRRTPP